MRFTWGRNIQNPIFNGPVTIGARLRDAWDAALGVLQIGRNGALVSQKAAGGSNSTILVQNAYLDGSGTWRYISDGLANQLLIGGQTLQYMRAVSGVAGASITWVASFTVNTSGVGIFEDWTQATHFKSTVATGTAPLIVASTTKVSNLNVDLLDGGDWAQPGAIGSSAPSSGAFTTLSSTSNATLAAAVINGGGSYIAGSIYTDSNWGMLFRAKQASPAAGEFRWANSVDAELMRISTTGTLELPYGQIKFPATQNASTNVNTLDDYEEGTWTPTVTAGSGTFTTVSGAGTYTKIGNRVLWYMKIDITTNGTAASSVRFTMPVGLTPGADAVFNGVESLAVGFTCHGIWVAASSYMQAAKYDNTYPGGSGYRLEFQGQYNV